ncbi:MAG: LysR family transcriptional regulator [Granulosicoccus sp.]
MSHAALPPLNWLRAFEASARHLSFTAAASELHLTQSAISQHIRSLERFLGKPLFVRQSRAIFLTEEATNYLPAVREAFRVLQTGTAAFPGLPSGRSVTLQCNMGFATFCLIPRMASLLAAHPWLELNIVTPIWNPEQTSARADVEIRFGFVDELGLAPQVTRLTRETYYPVCSPSIADDADWRVSPLFDCSGVLATWQGWLVAQGEALPTERAVTLFSTFAASIGAALAGAGLAMAHDSLVADALKNGHLIKPYTDVVEMSECYCLIEPQAHLRTPSSRALAEWLITEFQVSI